MNKSEETRSNTNEYKSEEDDRSYKELLFRIPVRIR